MFWTWHLYSMCAPPASQVGSSVIWIASMRSDRPVVPTQVGAMSLSMRLRHGIQPMFWTCTRTRIGPSRRSASRRSDRPVVPMVPSVAGSHPRFWT